MNRIFGIPDSNDSNETTANETTETTEPTTNATYNPTDTFRLPIETVEYKTLPQELIDDIDLNSRGDGDSVYRHIVNPTTPLAEHVHTKWASRYTTDKKFLTDTQNIVSHISKTIDPIDREKQDIRAATQTHLIERWKEISRRDKIAEFLEKYNYISPEIFRGLNESRHVLQGVSLYVIASPAISLIMPIISLIFPFIILRLRGVVISITTYFGTLTNIMSSHPIGKLFTQFADLSWDKIIYLLFSIGMYIVQIAQNVRTCSRYYRNLTSIHEDIFAFRDFAVETVDSMDRFDRTVNVCSAVSYSKFTDDMVQHRAVLSQFIDDVDCIGENAVSIRKYSEIGYVMKIFYRMHSDIQTTDTFNYAMGFSGYYENLSSLSLLILEGKMNRMTYIVQPVSVVGAYHPLAFKCVTDGATDGATDTVTNTYDFKKNIILSGPNASGKTTLIKSTLVNLILSQQIGYGFFATATTPIFDDFHCYLNIPDTSGRDSLFQAEARRCKDILDRINMNERERHFCIMDELYSGTNPEEAVAGAGSFVEYLSKNKMVSFMLTTHYTDLCKMFKRHNIGVVNYNMKTNVNSIESGDEELDYTYKLTPGISKIRGGTSVMCELKYPKEIINHMRELLYREKSIKPNKQTVPAEVST